MTTEQPRPNDLTGPAATDQERVTLVWNGLAELTARLDGTEHAVAGP